MDAFRFLDREGKGEIDFAMLLDSLENEIARYAPRGMSLTFTENELVAFIARYSQRREDERGNIHNKMSYSDFCAAVVPKDRHSLSILANRPARNLFLQQSYQDLFSEVTRARYL